MGKRLFGVTVAMVTPFDENGKIMEDKLKEYVSFLIDKRVNCLYPLGTTGEMYLMNVDERRKVAEIVVEKTSGTANVFIHVGAMRQEDTIELAKHAYSIGADGIGVVTPSYFVVDERELEEYYVSIAKSIPEDFPMYLYNLPQRTGNDLKTNVVEKIVKVTSNVVGIKYSLEDLLRTDKYLEINNGNFSVLQGCDRLFHSALALGCDGVVSGISSVCPEPFVAVYKAFNEGNTLEARKQQKIATIIAEILKSGTNIAYYKAALKLRGVDVGHVRKPLLNISKEQFADFKEQFIEYINKYII